MINMLINIVQPHLNWFIRNLVIFYMTDFIPNVVKCLLSCVIIFDVLF